VSLLGVSCGPGCWELLGVEVEDPGRERDVKGGVRPPGLVAGVAGLAEQPGGGGEGGDVEALELVVAAGARPPDSITGTAVLGR
jgi:hypothetical protein